MPSRYLEKGHNLFTSFLTFLSVHFIPSCNTSAVEIKELHNLIIVVSVVKKYIVVPEKAL